MTTDTTRLTDTKLEELLDTRAPGRPQSRLEADALACYEHLERILGPELLHRLPQGGRHTLRYEDGPRPSLREIRAEGGASLTLIADGIRCTLELDHENRQVLDFDFADELSCEGTYLEWASVHEAAEMFLRDLASNTYRRPAA
ncbi:MAG: hypothetical protein KDD47_10085 [Acidobacteria bacterium]|nr:hypothetical protein [Acidobacteriota bacterium]